MKFEAYHNYGRTSEELLLANNRIEDRFFAAIDAVADADGNPVCRSTLNPMAPPPPTSPFPAIDPGFRTFSPGDGTCQPLNIFGTGAASPQSVDFVTEDAVQTSVIDQHVAHISLSGNSTDLGFVLPSGPIGFAAGYEFRREFSRFRPDAFSLTGLSFDGTTVSGLQGSYDVNEGFAELSIPVLDKLPALEMLTLDAAIRVADYSTVGTNVSWRVGGTWT
ncbi:MAG: TonB-dependent receptor, partial [Planctomycetota bacterium]